MTTTTETRPALALTIDGTHATVSGVRFTWSLRCYKCREITRVSADGGRSLAGLNVSTSRKTVRWYWREKPPAMPALPAVCSCGFSDRPFAHAAGEVWREPMAESAVLGRLDQAYATIRAQFPELVKRADAALGRAS